MTAKKKAVKTEPAQTVQVEIAAPKFGIVEFLIRGTAPYVQHRFSAKAQKTIADKQKAGSQAKKGAAKEARDFEADYQGAMYRDKKGRHGMPCAGFRAAMISACRLVGAKMTIAKMALFVEPEIYDATDGTSLVVISGEPRMDVRPVRNATGVADLRARPMWMPGWTAKVRVRYDAEMYAPESVANLLTRAGMQVGVGEGRPDSRKSAGLDWGLFSLEESHEK